MMNTLIDVAAPDEAWAPRITDESTDDRQLVVISRQQLHHTPVRRGENVMEARFARFIVCDAIKHHSKNLPYQFLIQSANEAERAKAGHRPPDEATKARLAAAKRARIEMHRTCRIEGAAGELLTGDTPAAENHEGDTAMSKLGKQISEGVRGLRGKKAAKKSTAKKAASKKAAEKKIPAPSTKREWFAVSPTGTASQGFPSILLAAKSVGFKGKYTKLVKAGHYSVTVDEKTFAIVNRDAAKRDGILLPS
jgi:hypothetical protein